MNTAGAMTLGFARLNNILGQATVACKYNWDGGDVALTLEQFDLAAYLNSKLRKLENKDSVLSTEQRREIVARISEENGSLLAEIASSFGANYLQLDAQFNFLLMAAFALAEHKEQLSQSRRNIELTRQSNNSWMSGPDVRALLELTSKRNPATDSRKFVQR